MLPQPAAYTRHGMHTQLDPTIAALPGPPQRTGWCGRHWVGRRLSICWLVGLASCAAAPPPGATTPAPAPPVATARLLLRGAVPSDDRYAAVRLADALNCKDPQMLSSGDAHKPPAPAALAAGVLTTLDFVVLRAGKTSCVVRWSFTPEADKTYLVQGMVVGAGCTARLLDATQSDRPQPAKGAVLRSGPGQPCLALDQSRSAGEASSLIQGGQQQGEAVLNPATTARDLQGLIRP